MNAAHLLHLAQGPKPLERGQRLGDRVRRQQAGSLNLAAETAQCLLVEDRHQASRHPLIDDETNRVRADVDDRDAGSVLARPLHRKNPLGGVMTFGTAREAARRGFLKRLSTA